MLYGPNDLTLREAQVAEAVRRGMNNREIAEALGISEHVVKNHLRDIYDKTGMGNRVELALWWIEHREGTNGRG